MGREDEKVKEMWSNPLYNIHYTIQSYLFESTDKQSGTGPLRASTELERTGLYCNSFCPF